MQVKVLCVGDIVGRPGRQVLAEHLTKLVQERSIDCVIANAENAAGGSGLTTQVYDKLGKYGVHLITLGDHTYRKREIIDTLSNADNIVRPANLPTQAAGKEIAYFRTAAGPVVAIISLLGRKHMNLLGDNPFHAAARVLSKISDDIRLIIVDIHAEMTGEKVAMGWFLDGKVTAVFGTHTHVPTADETILPNGTAYITDVGMTGAHESVLGRNIEPVLKSHLTQMPFAYSIATGDVRMNGVIITADGNTGRASAIERICIKLDQPVGDAYDNHDGRPDPSLGD
ncbi:MAG: TIGR00282 family metallophosphoesterase [Sedimentisphaerales bacterium]|nr:TIGR00282 family metallophosphoesterase [Sedimentisphaerales bacterium]